MFVLLMIIAACFFLYAFVLILKGCLLLLKAAYYHVLLLFKKEKMIDRGYEKHIVKPSDDYKKFDKGFDENIDDIINPKYFKL
tara:strand:+ start:422 stop:670 length:249 start_codon:yes stop_codon:yes gene_type:complete